MVLSQVVNGVVLPFVLVFMLLLTNDRELMGEHVNSRGFNIIAWTTVVVMIVLTHRADGHADARVKVYRPATLDGCHVRL